MSTLQLEIDARGIATLTLNRPEKHNALTPQLLIELTQAGERLAQDPQVRVVVITGAGKSFCAGADLSHMRAMAHASEEEIYRDSLLLGRCLRTIDELPKPVIARVGGGAFGGGVGLVSCSDIAIASHNAAFALTEVRLGLIPAVVSRHVIAAIGARNARRLFLTAAPFTAIAAQELGLIHRVVSPTELERAVESEIELLLQGAPLAQAAAKALVHRIASNEPELNEQQESVTARLLAQRRTSPEGAEGIAAFLEKRSPKWRR